VSVATETGSMLYRNGLYDASAQEFRRSLQRTSTKGRPEEAATLHYLLARSELALNNAPAAWHSARQASALAEQYNLPDEVKRKAHYYTALACADLGHFTDAREALGQMRSIPGMSGLDEAKSLHVQGNIELESGDVAEALVLLGKAKTAYTNINEIGWAAHVAAAMAVALEWDGKIDAALDATTVAYKALEQQNQARRYIAMAQMARLNVMCGQVHSADHWLVQTIEHLVRNPAAIDFRGVGAIAHTLALLQRATGRDGETYLRWSEILRQGNGRLHGMAMGRKQFEQQPFVHGQNLRSEPLFGTWFNEDLIMNHELTAASPQTLVGYIDRIVTGTAYNESMDTLLLEQAAVFQNSQDPRIRKVVTSEDSAEGKLYALVRQYVTGVKEGQHYTDVLKRMALAKGRFDRRMVEDLARLHAVAA